MWHTKRDVRRSSWHLNVKASSCISFSKIWVNTDGRRSIDMGGCVQEKVRVGGGGLVCCSPSENGQKRTQGIREGASNQRTLLTRRNKQQEKD